MERRKKEKIRKFILIFICFPVWTAFGQNPNYINPGLFSFSTTLSPAMMLNRDEINYYVTGFIEGKLTEHLSLRGETNFLLGNSDSKFLKNNIRTTLGIQYGFSPVNNLELHLGFSPGFSFMKSNFDPSITEIVPVVQINGGVRYYVWKFFHFFANFSYVHEQMQNLDRVNGMADEFMISAGLGFNIQVLKRYRK